MKMKRTLSVIVMVVCMLCLSVPAFAYGYGYSGTGGGSGSSPYETPSGSGPVSDNPWYGYELTDPSIWRPNSGGSGLNMPGSGTGFGGSSGYPGSGGSSYPGGGYPGSGYPGSGSGILSGGGMPGSGTGGYGGGISGGHTPGTSGSTTGDHFNASMESDGTITIELPNATGVETGNPSAAFKTIFNKYKGVGIAITGLCTITAILSLLVQITKLGAAGDNQRLRTSAIKGIIYSGAVVAAFGSLALVTGFFWNAFTA